MEQIVDHGTLKHCELCGREATTTFHHLIPRTLHSKKRFKVRYSYEQLQCGLDLCKLCHHAVHHLLSERELGEKYYTRRLLLENEAIRRHVAWAKKQTRQR